VDREFGLILLAESLCICFIVLLHLIPFATKKNVYRRSIFILCLVVATLTLYVLQKRWVIRAFLYVMFAHVREVSLIFRVSAKRGIATAIKLAASSKQENPITTAEQLAKNCCKSSATVADMCQVH
jgi:hypothetical protein